MSGVLTRSSVGRPAMGLAPRRQIWPAEVTVNAEGEKRMTKAKLPHRLWTIGARWAERFGPGSERARGENPPGYPPHVSRIYSMVSGDKGEWLSSTPIT